MKNPYKRIKVGGKGIDEHRHVMQQHRELGRFEFVHHKNGDKRDNRLENLELVSPKQHAIEHGQWKHQETKACAVCGSVFMPSPTKRAIKKTCSKACRYALTAQTQSTPGSPRSRYRVPQVAAAFIEAAS